MTNLESKAGLKILGLLSDHECLSVEVIDSHIFYGMADASALNGLLREMKRTGVLITSTGNWCITEAGRAMLERESLNQV